MFKKNSLFFYISVNIGGTEVGNTVGMNLKKTCCHIFHKVEGRICDFACGNDVQFEWRRRRSILTYLLIYPISDTRLSNSSQSSLQCAR